MYRITGTIQGVAPLLYNRPDKEIIEPDEDKTASTGRMSKAERFAIAECRAYRDEGGVYYPGINLKRCLEEGCKKAGLKVRRASLMSYLRASVFVDMHLHFDKKEYDFMHEHWGRVPPRTGGVVIIRRPAFREGWKLSFGMTIVDDRINSGDIRRSLDEGGLLVGMGSWRPEYGRFIVTDWNIEKELLSPARAA